MATIFATVLTAAPQAHAVDQGSLRNSADTTKCIGIDGSSTAQGALARLFPCDGTQNQNYTFQPTGGGYFLIKAGHSGKCLTGGSSPGTPVAQFNCNSKNAGENFRKRNVKPPFFSLESKNNQLCIGVSGGAPKFGAQIAVFACDGKKNQQWRR